MMESLILLLLSSGLYRANHGTAMTAHANRGFGAVGWNGMPVPSRAWRSRRARDAPFAAQRGVTRAAALQPRYDVPAAAGGIIRTGRRRVGEGGGSCLAAPAHSPWRSRASAPSGSLLLPGRAACIVPRCLRVHTPGSGAARAARAANTGHGHRCRTRDGVNRRAPARGRAPGGGLY